MPINVSITDVLEDISAVVGTMRGYLLTHSCFQYKGFNGSGDRKIGHVRFPYRVFLKIHRSLPSLHSLVKPMEAKRSGVPFQSKFDECLFLGSTG